MISNFDPRADFCRARFLLHTSDTGRTCPILPPGRLGWQPLILAVIYGSCRLMLRSDPFEFAVPLTWIARED